MKTYEYYGSSPDGWNVSGTLKVEGNERFDYSEGMTDYTNASLSGGATGTWQREGNVLLFRVEKVYTPVYFPWGAWSVLRAEVRGDELDFGGGLKMSEPGEHMIRVLVHNKGGRPLPVRLEPWGRDAVLEPGEKLHIVGRGPYSWLKHKVARGADEVVYHGWPGSRAEVEYDPKPPAPPKLPAPAPPAAPPPPAVTAPAAESPVRPQVTAPAPFPTGARFEKRLPSRELATLLFKWINELDPYDPVNPINIACRVHGAIPLDGNQSYVWALRADGLVLRFKREEFAPPGEPEEDAEVAYDMIAAGAERHPELSELLPPDRRND